MFSVVSEFSFPIPYLVHYIMYTSGSQTFYHEYHLRNDLALQVPPELK